MSCLFIGNKAASEKRTLSQNGLLSPRKSKDYLLIHFLSSSDSMLINCVFFFLRWSKKWDIGYISFLFKYEMNLITVGDFFSLLCVSLLFFEIFLKAVKQWKTMETIGGKNYMFESDSYHIVLIRASISERKTRWRKGWHSNCFSQTQPFHSLLILIRKRLYP